MAHVTKPRLDEQRNDVKIYVYKYLQKKTYLFQVMTNTSGIYSRPLLLCFVVEFANQ